MNKKPLHSHGSLVYLKTDIDQFQRQVLRVITLPGGTVMYEVALGLEQSAHFECELTTEPSKNNGNKVGF